MLHALLLSPDDQAVNAITGVLEEMSVTCERPLDGVSAAQKLNSQSFDLVLVDCENLPAAKLIFDVCRRAKSGANPVPIAIVDGRAGLPTAFRLGAELILTKPVAKDQARSTVRTAVSRARKDGANEAKNTDSAGANEAVVEERAMAAAAGASSQTTSFAEAVQRDPAAPAVADAAVADATYAAADASGYANCSSSMEAPSVDPASQPSLQTPGSESSEYSTAEMSARVYLRHAKSEPLAAPSTEMAAALLPAAKPEKTRARELQSENFKPARVAPASALEKARVQWPSPNQYGGGQGRGPLVASLMLLLAAGGFYATWTYQPGFREVAQPQISRLLKPRSTVQPRAAKAGLAGNPAPSRTIRAANPPAQPAPKLAPPIALDIKPVSSTTSSDSVSTEHPKLISAAVSDAPLPGENSTKIVLSSKGAEKRLARKVSPKYPIDARAEDADSRIELKTVVNENGEVEDARLVRGNSTLASVAIQAVKQWRYRPYVRDGKPQAFQTIVFVDFQQP